jgi:hypothetical protein
MQVRGGRDLPRWCQLRDQAHSEHRLSPDVVIGNSRANELRHGRF